MWGCDQMPRGRSWARVPLNDREGLSSHSSSLGGREMGGSEGTCTHRALALCPACVTTLLGARGLSLPFLRALRLLGDQWPSACHQVAAAVGTNT